MWITWTPDHKLNDQQCRRPRPGGSGSALYAGAGSVQIQQGQGGTLCGLGEGKEKKKKNNNKTNKKLQLYCCFFFFVFFDLGFMALSRIFHLYRADRSSKVGENRRTRRKTTWPSVSRTWLSHIWPERGSNHSGEKPNGLRVNSLIH